MVLSGSVGGDVLPLIREFWPIFTAIFGAVGTLFFQAVLPDTWKLKIDYVGKHLKKRYLDGDIVVDSKLSRRYDVESDEQLYELSNSLWDEFGTQPTGDNDIFQFTRDRGGKEFSVMVTLYHESGSENDIQIDSADISDVFTDGGEPPRKVTGIRISVSDALPYSNLKDLLFREYDLLRDIDNEIPCNMEGGTYSLTCDSGEPPQINHFFSKMNISSLSASNDNTHLKYDNDGIVVKNVGEGQVDQVIDLVYKLVTLYS